MERWLDEEYEEYVDEELHKYPHTKAWREALGPFNFVPKKAYYYDG